MSLPAAVDYAILNRIESNQITEGVNDLLNNAETFILQIVCAQIGIHKHTIARKKIRVCVCVGVLTIRIRIHEENREFFPEQLN